MSMSERFKNIRTRLLERKGTVIISLAILTAFMLISTRPERPVKVPQVRSAMVDVVEARPTTLQPTLDIFGLVESPKDSELRAAVEADVTNVAVRDGQAVQAGDILASLDDRDAQLILTQRQADVADQEAQLKLAQTRLKRNRQALEREQELLEISEANFERTTELHTDGLVSRFDLDTSAETLKRQQLAVTQRQLTLEENEIQLVQLQAQLSRQEALRDQAQLELDRTRITAPFNGVITAVAISPGDRVRVGDSLLRIHNPESLEIRTQIPGRYVPSVSAAVNGGLGLEAFVKVNEQSIPAELVRVAGQASENTGGVDGFVRFSGAAPADVRLGSTVGLTLSLPPQDNLVAVPFSAVSGRDQLYTVEDGRMRLVEVERVGETRDAEGASLVLIRSANLSAGDRIVTTRLATAVDGLSVRVRGETPAEDEAVLSQAANQP